MYSTMIDRENETCLWLKPNLCLAWLAGEHFSFALLIVWIQDKCVYGCKHQSIKWLDAYNMCLEYVPANWNGKSMKLLILTRLRSRYLDAYISSHSVFLLSREFKCMYFCAVTYGRLEYMPQNILSFAIGTALETRIQYERFYWVVESNYYLHYRNICQQICV